MIVFSILKSVKSPKWRKQHHFISSKFAGAAPPAASFRRPSNHLVIIRDVIVRPTEGGREQSGRRCRPSVSALPPLPRTTRATFSRSGTRQPDRRTHRDDGGGGGDGGGMALPKNGKSPMQKGESSKKGLYRRAPKRYSRFRADCDPRLFNSKQSTKPRRYIIPLYEVVAPRPTM